MKEQLATVASTIDRHQMLNPAVPVLVAFSGGPDSTALAILLQELGYQTILAHVDHRMRPGSAADAVHCESVAGGLGRRFLVERVSVDPPTQAQARQARYDALHRMLVKSGAERIATGHSLDDQAETVKMRLDRGGYGLGIPPVRGRVVRPVLELRRAQLRAVCAEAGVEYLNDPSNENTKYARVRVRAELASRPEEYSRELAALAEKSRREAEATARAVETAAARLVGVAEDEISIDRAGLRALEPAVARQLLLRLTREQGAEVAPRLAGEILNKVVPTTGASLDLASGLAIWAEPDVLVLGRRTEALELPEVEIPVPGVAESAAWGLNVMAEPASLTSPLRRGKDEELVDADAVGVRLVLRQWRPGDRIEPLGMEGTKKLQDLFVDAGVPRRQRRRVPLLESDGRIVWVVGHRLDRRFRITERSRAAIRLAVEPTAVSNGPKLATVNG